jgi:putative membrane protein
MNTIIDWRPRFARAARRVAAAWTVVLAGLLVPLAAAADAPGDGTYGDYGHHGMWGGGWIGATFGFIMMIAVIAGIVAVIVLLFRALGSGSGGQAAQRRDGKTALDILEDRFARGEIDAQEFEERRRLLGD